MTYNNAIPQPGDELSVSQGDILTNFQVLNNSFGVDHYPYNDLTANNGKHNQLTTPEIAGGVHPSTAGNEPKFYAMEDSVNVGVIQYSRGPSDAVPTPITTLQSPSTPIFLVLSGTTNVLDFSGLTLAYAKLTAIDTSRVDLPIVQSVVRWNGTTLVVRNSSDNFALTSQASGSVLQIRNTIGATLDVYWTLQLLRIA